MNAFAQIFRALGPIRLAALGGMVVVLFAFFSFLSTRLSSGDMALLYSDLDVADSSQIVRRLDTMKVPYKVHGGGSQIWVPSDDVARLRLNMAEDGLPTGGSIGYEIFDKGEGFGTSAFMQNLNLVRALEGELSRTITSLSSVKSARVHIVLPKREAFSREKSEPSASIALNMGGARLKKEQVMAIQHLVAAAVPGLKPSQISMVDNHGTLLARGFEDEGGSALSFNTAHEMKEAYETRLSRSLEELLERSVGAGKVRVEVAALLDFDRVTTNKETYDPDGRVLRSSQTNEETNDSNSSSDNKAVGADSNLPGGAAGGSGSGNSSKVKRTGETNNYEISKVIENQLKEAGNVKKLSVAVLVDGIYTPAADGTKTYAARAPEELKKLETLVKSAVGFDAGRGDNIDVVNMQFVMPDDIPEPNAKANLLELYGKDFIRLAEKLILAILGLLVLLIIVRPLMNKFFDLTSTPLPYDSNALPAGADMLGLSGPRTMQLGSAGGGEEDATAKIDLAKVEGQVNESSIRKVSQLVNNHPQETVTVIRSWLHQEG